MQEQAAILSAHNIERTKHGVASLYWDYSASDFAESYVSKCPGDILLLLLALLRAADKSLCQQEVYHGYVHSTSASALLACKSGR